jgi:hypothetical protein
MGLAFHVHDEINVGISNAEVGQAETAAASAVTGGCLASVTIVFAVGVQQRWWHQQ